LKILQNKLQFFIFFVHIFLLLVRVLNLNFICLIKAFFCEEKLVRMSRLIYFIFSLKFSLFHKLMIRTTDERFQIFLFIFYIKNKLKLKSGMFADFVVF